MSNNPAIHKTPLPYMAYYQTTATKKIATMSKRIRVVCGGTSASKTISILLYLIARCQTDKTPTLTSVVSESFPHLRRGSMRDFLNIMQEHGYYKDELWSKTDYTYTFETGSKLEFFSADMPSKVRGPRRDRLFMNEGNNIAYESWDQLLIRTKEFAFLDYNPTTEFWAYEELIGKRDDVEFITLTYLDNEALDQSIVSEIESHKHNKNWWAVYGLGQLGEVEGRVYKDWAIIDSIPHEARLERRGLDFGFSNDPSAIIDVYYYNGGYILSERLYRKGMLNNQLASYLQNLDNPNTLIIADSAEPKSIAELQTYDLPIIGVQKKGFGNKNYLAASIDYMQQQRISVTKASTNLIKEYRNYLWMTDKDGKIINEPDGGLDHALDAARYAFDGLRPQEVEEKDYKTGNVMSTWV
jgi:phage terminase large subunit